MEETINLRELFKIVKKRFFFIMSIIIFGVMIAGIVSYTYLTPTYEASTQILITQQKGEKSKFDMQDIQTNLQLINTYNVIIKSPAILSSVIKKLELDMTTAELNEKISVNNEQNSQVVNVIVQDPELDKAVKISNMTVEVFQEEIRTLMNLDNVNILSPAVYVKNQSPVRPNPILNMAIAAVVGMMLGIGITFLLELLNTTLKTEQDIEELLGLPILGFISTIPDNGTKTAKKLVSHGRGRRGKGV